MRKGFSKWAHFSQTSGLSTNLREKNAHFEIFSENGKSFSQDFRQCMLLSNSFLSYFDAWSRMVFYTHPLQIF